MHTCISLSFPVCCSDATSLICVSTSIWKEQQNKDRELDRVEQTNKKQQKLEEVESRPADHSQLLATLREWRQEATRMKQKDVIVKSLRHAILTLGKGCNTSLMSANFSNFWEVCRHEQKQASVCKLHKSTLWHPSFMPQHPSRSTLFSHQPHLYYASCVREAYSAHVYI